MRTTNTLILGGGQAGLALSRCLTAMGGDHLVIERGRTAERWHSERWDSLRLLTPNWMTRLPGCTYDGPDPDGFMTAPQVAAFFGRYAASFDAPVHQHTAVHHLTSDGEGFVVTTSDGLFRSANVVIATGWCDRTAIPAFGRHLSRRIHQVVPADYRSPDDVPAGGVLVVGASATGVQLADELHRSGRHVTVAVGSHSRIPRRYRGLDIFQWLDLIGAFDKTIDDVSDVTAARSEPSLQLVGRDDHRTLDLATLQADGVRLVGRLSGVDGTRVTLATNLRALINTADQRMARVLARIDAAIERLGLTAEVFDAEPIPPVTPMSVPDTLDLDAAGITTIVWATGHRRPYPWLDLPILDRHGEICQYRGVTPVPGAYVLGQRFQHYRNSNFIDGVGRDAHYIAEHIGRTRHPGTALQDRATPGAEMNSNMSADDQPFTLRRGASHDVIVVGARAAGAATAMLLARDGLRVLLLDRGPLGADTLSTHALMRGGVLQLSRWGLLDQIIAASTPPVTRTTFRYGDENVVITIKPSYGVDALYAPRRTLLDPVLVDAAVDAGVEVRHSISVTDLIMRHGRVVGVHATTSDGRSVALGAPLVIGADGIRSIIAKRVGAAFSRVGQHASATTYGYWNDLATDGYEWNFHPNACSGVIPTNDGKACVFAAATPKRIGRGGVALLSDVIAEGAPRLAERLRRASPPQGTRTWPGHPGYLRRCHGPGWALVGDAGYFKDPLSAHGLTDALRDVELLARAVSGGFGHNTSLDDALEDYQTTRDRLSIPLFDVVDRIASQQWDDTEIAHLLLRLSSAMTDEIEALAALTPQPVP